MKTFFSVLAAILCAAAVIKGVQVAVEWWTSSRAEALAPSTKPEPPAVRKQRTYQKKPRIVLRSATEVGVIQGTGNVVISVQDERIDYAEDDEEANAMPEEAKLETYLARITVDHGARTTIDLSVADVSQILAGVERLPVPFIPHSDEASASFHFRDRLYISVVRAAKKNLLEIALDGVAMATEVGQLESLKNQLSAARHLMVSRDKGQRTPLTPTGSPAKNKEPRFITLPAK